MSGAFNGSIFNPLIFDAESGQWTPAPYLLPSQDIEQPLSGEELEDFLQSVIVGVLGIEGSKVRPRWQAESVPNLPPANESWVAFGITTTISDTNAAVLHDGDGDGSDTLLRQQLITTLCSFYGPLADSYAGILQDGLQIAQNREALTRAGFGFISTSDAIRMPSLTKEKWLMRIDVQAVFTRQVRRRYTVPNIESAPLVLDAERVKFFLDVEQ